MQACAGEGAACTPLAGAQVQGLETAGALGSPDALMSRHQAGTAVCAHPCSPARLGVCPAEAASVLQRVSMQGRSRLGARGLGDLDELCLGHLHHWALVRLDQPCSAQACRAHLGAGEFDDPVEIGRRSLIPLAVRCGGTIQRTWEPGELMTLMNCPLATSTARPLYALTSWRSPTTL